MKIVTVWEEGDIASFRDDKGKLRVAIRRTNWPNDETPWQVAIHGFYRVSDEFITEHGTLMVPAS